MRLSAVNVSIIETILITGGTFLAVYPFYDFMLCELFFFFFKMQIVTQYVKNVWENVVQQEGVWLHRLYRFPLLTLTDLPQPSGQKQHCRLSLNNTIVSKCHTHFWSFCLLEIQTSHIMKHTKKNTFLQCVKNAQCHL